MTKNAKHLPLNKEGTELKLTKSKLAKNLRFNLKNDLTGEHVELPLTKIAKVI